MELLSNFLSFIFQSFGEMWVIGEETVAYWAPIILGFFFWKAWIYYVQSDYISKIDWVLLEIKLPRDIHKPLQAMEFILTTLDQPSAGSKIEQWWAGRVPLWFSLELVSIEGNPRFFVRAPKKFKDLIESRFYSQYPDIEISEVPDYTDHIDYVRSGAVSLFGSEFVLTKEDSIPIKTYVEYGMEKPMLSMDNKDQRFDPLSPVIEFLGSVGSGEQIWIQILVQSAKKRYVNANGELKDWREEGKDFVKEAIEGKKKEPSKTFLGVVWFSIKDIAGAFFSAPEEEKKEDKKERPQLSPGTRDNISAIERNLGKVGLDCGIRAIYLSERGKFKAGNIPSLMNCFKQFSSSEGLNGFKPNNVTSLDYPWDKLDEVTGNYRVGKMNRKIFESYKTRSYFYPPHKRKPFVLTTEELATIFHLPSGVSQTPTLSRIDSKKVEPPVNLPI